MRSVFNFVAMQLCLSIVLLASGAGARARDNAAPRLLSADQGQALADFALRFAPGVYPQPDCSHLVHMLYTQAGLNYSYEGSRALHRGLPGFVRVKTPQPGDLIVWMGHVGIVLSLDDTTFLSSVRSGVIAESWTNDYWTARGRPRFFRYVLGPKADLTLLTAVAPQANRRIATRQAQPQKPSAPGLRTEKSVSPAPSFSNVSSVETSSVIVMRQRGKANTVDVAAALHQDQLDLASRLLAGERLDSSRPLSVVEHLEVTRIEVKHGAGAIRVKFSETLALEHGAVISGRTVERELKLNLRDGAWIISDPEQRFYIPRAQAIDIFELQVELTAQSNTVHTDKRAIIRALALLYDQEPAIASAQARSR